MLRTAQPGAEDEAADSGNPMGTTVVKICPPGLSPEERARRNARDLALLNRYADELNADAVDGLEFQAEVDVEEKKIRVGKKTWDRRR